MQKLPANKRHSLAASQNLLQIINHIILNENGHLANFNLGWPHDLAILSTIIVLLELLAFTLVVPNPSAPLKEKL